MLIQFGQMGDPHLDPSFRRSCCTHSFSKDHIRWLIFQGKAAMTVDRAHPRVSTGALPSLNWTRIRRNQTCFRGGAETAGESAQPVRDRKEGSVQDRGCFHRGLSCVCYHWIQAVWCLCLWLKTSPQLHACGYSSSAMLRTPQAWASQGAQW